MASGMNRESEGVEIPGENETTMAEDNTGGASSATGENEGGSRDSASGAAGDNVGTSGASGMVGDVTGTMDYEGVVIADPPSSKVKRDLDGKIFPVRDDIVDEAVARGVSFEDGTRSGISSQFQLTRGRLRWDSNSMLPLLRKSP